MICYLYMIRSQLTGKYYIGSSINPKKRILEHNTGKTISTRGKGPWVLCFSQKFLTLKEARKVEYKLKRMKSRKILEQIIKDRYIKMKV